MGKSPALQFVNLPFFARRCCMNTLESFCSREFIHEWHTSMQRIRIAAAAQFFFKVLFSGRSCLIRYRHLKELGAVTECVQHAGEVMFTPARYMHATINLADTVAVAGNFCQHRHVMLSAMFPSVNFTTAGGHPPSFSARSATLEELTRDSGCWDPARSPFEIEKHTVVGFDVYDPTSF